MRPLPSVSHLPLRVTSHVLPSLGVREDKQGGGKKKTHGGLRLGPGGCEGVRSPRLSGIPLYLSAKLVSCPEDTQRAPLVRNERQRR